MIMSTVIIIGSGHLSKMKTRSACFFSLIIVLLGLSLGLAIAVASRPFAPYDHDAHSQDQILLPPHAAYVTKQNFDTGAKGMEGGRGYGSREAVKRGLRSSLGSRPPSCEHKCGRCIPCNAIQAPTTTDHLGIQYANYEPEGWKCKCGTSFYNP